MAKPDLVQSVYKLALVGEEAGLTLEDMIQILQAGASVKTLLGLIEARLGTDTHHPTSSSAWIV